MAVRASFGVVLAAALSGCLATVHPAGGQDASFAFAALSEDGSWVLVDHAGGACVAVADRTWRVMGDDAAERDAQPMAWDDGEARPGAAEWCRGERRAFALEDGVFTRLRVLADGKVVATVEQPEAFTAVFLKDEQDQQQDRVVVTAAVSYADWNRLGIRADGPGTSVILGTSNGTAEPMAVDRTLRRLSGSKTPLSAGDYLDFCGTAGAAGTRTYAIADLWSNTILYETTFQDVWSCG